MTITHLHETPSERAHRRVAEWAQEAVARELKRDCPDPRVPWSELTPGDLIRLVGEWHHVVAIRSDGRLRLEDEQARRFWYPAGEGETFLKFEDGF